MKNTFHNNNSKTNIDCKQKGYFCFKLKVK